MSPYSTILGEALYKYEGRGIRIPQSAEMSRDFYPHGKYHKLVQAALDECAQDVRASPRDYDWRGGRVMDFTLDLESSELVEQFVVAVKPDEDIVYGRYQLHKARSPQDSPFVRDLTRPVLVSALTIELVQSRGSMMLIRAYGGSYAPPLPWQVSADNYEGKIKQSCEFWRNHAFVAAPSIVPQGKLHSRRPQWVRELVH